MSKPTWDELRARSEGTDARGRRCFCADCYFLFKSGGFGCLKHTIPAEMEERDALINAGARQLADMGVPQ